MVVVVMVVVSRQLDKVGHQVEKQRRSHHQHVKVSRVVEVRKEDLKTLRAHLWSEWSEVKCLLLL